MASEIAREIAALRHFNRFYTVEAGLLADGLPKSDFSLTEARVLYELAHREDATAAELKRDLNLDAGYLSRILKRFSTRGLVERATDKDDARKALLTLTGAGREAYAGLDRASSEDARLKLAALSARNRTALVSAMAKIERLLDRKKAPARAAFTLRPPRVGDVGWIAHRQGLLYATEYGWDASFEALAAEILGAFVRDFDPEWERGWVAEQNGVPVGSVFAVRKSKKVAKLRLLYVEPSARGLGIGRRLVGECVAFARAKGYAKMTLWTQSSLTAARAVYEKAGFRLMAEERHHAFGKDLVGETWELDLRSRR
jgi:DNA-binding MarR family transcriptional regulator/GNAT superfamily N-acetyltransferase